MNDAEKIEFERSQRQKLNPIQEQLEEFTEKCRMKILESVDEVYFELTGRHKQGWTDADLPELFKSVDTHIEKLFWRSKGLNA